MPSAPLIPTPMSASCSIPTSFAPSPIARVVFLVLILTNLVTRAFCFGEIRQHKTDAQSTARSRNEFLRLPVRASVRALPSMIRANGVEVPFSEIFLLASCNFLSISS
uniref:Uncharacterized protein n=1 Tax=Arundo donax TaxID=35708 RepID=A0A0A9GFV0_ARUDO